MTTCSGGMRNGCWFHRLPFLLLWIESQYYNCVSACTTLLVGRKATIDGSVLVSHSDDGGGIADPRIMHVPARATNKHRDILPDLEDYPRYVGYDRGSNYYPERIGRSEHELTKPIGSIDIEAYIPNATTLTSTYSYFDGTYGIINSKQLILGGESTCSAIFTAKAISEEGGKALLCINELTRIALEYTSTARDAIQLMGDLAVKYGFYGASNNFEGGAESLLVADSTEGFVFHILPDDTGASAIWVAQRVPDDHVTVVANMFTIRCVNHTDKFNFMGNFDYMYEVAKRNQLWEEPKDKDDDSPLLDFTKTFSNGEYGHKYYSGRRMWGAYRLLAPSLDLNPEYDNLQLEADMYPWSIKPDQLLSLQDLFAVHRNYYQDTPYDLSKGLASGPFGNPDRFTVLHSQRHAIQEQYYPSANTTTSGEQPTGPGWERPIALFRTTYTTVAQARHWLDDSIGGVMWLGSYAPHGTCFLPFAIGVDALPNSITQGHMTQLDRSTAFWTFRYIHSLTRLRYNMLSKIIQQAQDYWEGVALQLQQSIEELSHSQQQGPKVAASTLNELYENHTTHVLKAWWDLADQLVFLYADGYDNQKEYTAPSLGYSMEWLEGVGYQNGPPPVPAPLSPQQRASSSSQPQQEEAAKNNNPFHQLTMTSLLFWLVVLVLVLALFVTCRKMITELLGFGDGSGGSINLLDHNNNTNDKHHHHHHPTILTPETVRCSSSDSLDDDDDDNRFAPLETRYGSL